MICYGVGWIVVDSGETPSEILRQYRNGCDFGRTIAVSPIL